MRFRNQIVSHRVALVFIFVVSSISISCSKKSDSSSTLGVTINGAAILGPVSGATVTAYPVKAADGSLDTTSPLATASTDASGKYSMSVPAGQTGAVGVQITGGSYKEEGSGATVLLGSKSFTTLLPSVSGGATLTATLGPLPDMAYQRFQTQMASGVPSGSTIAELASSANYAVSQAFGISDVVGVIPANTYGTLPNDATGQYALVMAALSKSAQTAGVDSVAMAQAYAANFKGSGVFNPSAVSVTTAAGSTVSVTPPTLSALATTTTNIGNGTTTLTGVTPPAGFVAPTMNPVPPAVAPPTYIVGAPPATTAPITPGSGTAASCAVGSVAGSVTHSNSIGGTTMTVCTDYVGSSYSLTMLQSMCPMGMTGCTVSASACSVVNTSGYAGGCRLSSGQPGDQITRYYGGYSSGQAANLCNSSMPACSSGT